MAKISVKGKDGAVSVAVARYAKGEARLVLCSDGRLLGKYLAGDGYVIRAKGVDRKRADAHALLLGYKAV